MTVCTVSMFLWVYGNDDVGVGIVTASDRMLTDLGLGVEYEGSRRKVAMFGPHHMIFISGNLSFGSLVLQGLYEQLAGGLPQSTIQLTIELGDVIGRLNADRAARKYLSPLGITAAAILANEKGLGGFGLPDSLVEQLASQMQSEKADIEAIVVGHDGRIANIYHVDGEGIFSSHIDVGFLSIGTGAVHASSQFMQLPYQHSVGYHSALRSTFFAKKAAEAAPGVGKVTDMMICTANGITPVSLQDMRVLERGYEQHRRHVTRSLDRLTLQLGQKDQSTAFSADTLKN